VLGRRKRIGDKSASPAAIYRDLRTMALASDGGDPRGGLGARHTSDATAKLPSGSDRLTMTVSEAAAVLGISRALTYELVARGEIPAIRLGRRIVVPTKHLQELVFGGVGASDAP
jgi:excisionase family DNA binding protein